jgi:hypothetical protein
MGARAIRASLSTEYDNSLKRFLPYAQATNSYHPFVKSPLLNVKSRGTVDGAIEAIRIFRALGFTWRIRDVRRER